MIEEYGLPQTNMRTYTVMIVLTCCAVLIPISDPITEILVESEKQAHTGGIGGGGQSGGGKLVAYPHVLEETLSSSVSISDTAWLNEQEIIVVGWYSSNVTVGNQTLVVDTEGVSDMLVARIALGEGVVWSLTANCSGEDKLHSVAIEKEDGDINGNNSTIWVGGAFQGSISIGSQTLAPSASNNEVRAMVSRMNVNGAILDNVHSEGNSGQASVFDLEYQKRMHSVRQRSRLNHSKSWFQVHRLDWQHGICWEFWSDFLWPRGCPSVC